MPMKLVRILSYLCERKKEDSRKVCIMSKENRGMFLKLVSISEAIELLRQTYRPPRTRIELALKSSLGFVIAEDISATFDIPPFDRSRVDGYAVRSSDTFSAD